MRLECRAGFVGLAVATLGTAAAASEPAKTEANPRLLNLPEVLTAKDYPSEAIQKQEQGTAGIRLTINPEGRVTACRVEKSSGSATLDATSCRVYRERARFEPAEPAAKQRVFDTRVAWSLGSPGLSRQGWFHRSAMAIKADGSVASCRVESSEAPDTNCWLPQSFPADSAANFVRLAGSDPAIFVTEIRFYPDEQVPEETAGRQLLSRRAARIAVKSDGTHRSCEVLEAGGSDSVCQEARQYRFEKIEHAPDARGTVYFWTYLEPKQ